MSFYLLPTIKIFKILEESKHSSLLGTFFRCFQLPISICQKCEFFYYISHLIKGKTNASSRIHTQCGETGTIVHSWWKFRWYRCYGKQYGNSLEKLNLDLPHDAAISLLDIYPKELKAGSPKGICTLMFIAALFPIVKRWKRPKCPSTNEWIKNGV